MRFGELFGVCCEFCHVSFPSLLLPFPCFEIGLELTSFGAVQGLVVLFAAIDAARHRYSPAQREERRRQREEYWQMREAERVSREGAASLDHFLW